MRQPLFAHFVVGWRCTFAQLEGRLEEAERLAGESYEMRRALGTQDAESVFARGDAPRAAAHFEHALTLCTAAGAAAFTARARADLALVTVA